MSFELKTKSSLIDIGANIATNYDIKGSNIDLFSSFGCKLFERPNISYCLDEDLQNCKT